MAKLTASSLIRVAMVDDHPMVREGTEGLLRDSEGLTAVWSAGDAAACLRMIRESRPDVLLLDLHLPDLSGIELARRIREEAPEVKVVILTGYDYEAYRHELEQMGISIFVDKAATGREILAAIHAAARSEPSAPNPTAQESSPHRLTPREREVLTLMATGHRNPAIAEVLCVSLKTVEFHVSNTLNKLGARSRLEAVIKGLTYGLVPAALVTPTATAGHGRPGSEAGEDLSSPVDGVQLQEDIRPAPRSAVDLAESGI